MESFLFKDSQYDFDQVLIDADYKVTEDFENSVTFSKKLEIKNEFSDKFTEIYPFTISVKRPTKLQKSTKYENGSPYRFTFLFCVAPMHTIRRIQWDTFPGDANVILDTMIKIVEDEAEACAYAFMQTSVILMKKTEEIIESKTTED